MARIGLGLAALGRPGYLNVGHGSELGDDRSVGALRARTFAVLDAAYGDHPIGYTLFAKLTLGH